MNTKTEIAALAHQAVYLDIKEVQRVARSESYLEHYARNRERFETFSKPDDRPMFGGEVVVNEPRWKVV